MLLRLKAWFAVILLLFLNTSRALASNDSVVIRGAASMLHLCQQLLGMYQTQSHGVQVGVNVAESFESLPPGGNSVWQSVRPLDKTRKRQLQEHFGSGVHEIPIAIEGVVVVLHPGNPVAELTLEQLRSIYTGKTTNWKQVGGREGAIHLYSTEAMVGGSLYFTDLILQGEEIDTTMRGYVNPKETETAVAQDANGIGLIPLPSGKDVKYPRIRRTAGSPAIEVSTENIRTLRYPLSSYVYWEFADKHEAAITQLVQFTVSRQGQLAVEAAGYYPLDPGDRTRASAALVASRK